MVGAPLHAGTSSTVENIWPSELSNSMSTTLGKMLHILFSIHLKVQTSISKRLYMIIQAIRNPSLAGALFQTLTALPCMSPSWSWALHPSFPFWPLVLCMAATTLLQSRRALNFSGFVVLVCVFVPIAQPVPIKRLAAMKFSHLLNGA